MGRKASNVPRGRLNTTVRQVTLDRLLQMEEWSGLARGQVLDLAIELAWRRQDPPFVPPPPLDDGEVETNDAAPGA